MNNMKSLIYGIIDEKDAEKWKSLILNNRKKSDFMVLGSVSPIGSVLESFRNYGIDIFQISEEFEDFHIHRNALLKLIKNNIKFKDSTFFINIDSDEEVEGEFPSYLDTSIDYTWYYIYEDIIYNGRYINGRAFSGKHFPTWGGVVHDHFIDSSKNHKFSNSFKLIHRRQDLSHNNRYIGMLNKKFENTFETRLAFIHEAYKSGVVNGNTLLLEDAYNIMRETFIPDRVVGYSSGYLNAKLLIYKSLIARSLGFKEEARVYAEDLYKNNNQRIGYYIDWLIEKKDTELYISKYNLFNLENIQYIDMIHPHWK